MQRDHRSGQAGSVSRGMARGMTRGAGRGVARVHVDGMTCRKCVNYIQARQRQHTTYEQLCNLPFIQFIFLKLKISSHWFLT